MSRVCWVRIFMTERLRILPVTSKQSYCETCSSYNKETFSLYDWPFYEFFRILRFFHFFIIIRRNFFIGSIVRILAEIQLFVMVDLRVNFYKH